jgi:uncharacterized protein YjiS (DUF1127 family)
MIDTRKTAAFAFGTARNGVIGLASRAVQVWLNRRRERAQLAQLDAHLLRDIGLSEMDARREATKHFWIE